MFVELGARLLDADQISRQLLSKEGEGYGPVIEHFGSDILYEDGQINRERLADIVFANKDELQVLNSITHPLVAKKMLDGVLELSSENAVIILDIPLLAENPNRDAYGIEKIIVVDAPLELCVKRLVQYRNMSVDDAVHRIEHQASREDRVKIADYLISNAGSIDDLTHRVKEVYSDLISHLNI
jgi:dephospho-CoA kinase